MKYCILVLIIGLSLSMDAFALSISYGQKIFNKKRITIIALTVGIFHFLMPFLGANLFKVINHKMIINSPKISNLIFMILGIEMMFSGKKNNKEKNISTFINIILFSISVSIDSFTIGISMNLKGKTSLFMYICFFVESFLMTFLGLNIAKIINKKIGKKGLILGGAVLIALGVLNF